MREIEIAEQSHDGSRR